MCNRDKADNQLTDFKRCSGQFTGIITSVSGNPVAIHDAIQTVGTEGQSLLQDVHYLEEMGRFNRERIPERVVHAKGAGAFGYLDVTHDITKYCAAKIFAKVKKRTPVAVRFSTVGGEAGSADTMRDPRGFAIKFYTEDGIWDLVGNNSPVFFIRDPTMFPLFMHTQKRNGETHLKDANMYWDFITLRPETTHQICFMFSDRGTPDGYRHMNGYGVHTFKMVNADMEQVYVKFHFKPTQGVQNLTAKKAKMLIGQDPDYATRDLYNAIENGRFPSWKMFIQVMTMLEARDATFNPFDDTKVWSHKQFPLIPVGKLVLDRNPTNYFSEIEQLAFSPSNLVPGIEPSPDKMLQGRLFAYADTQRHRLGPNYLQIPVNCPYRVPVKNYQRNGAMTVTNNQANAPNYYPNSFSGPLENLRAKQLQACSRVAGEVCRFSSADEDNYSQVTAFWTKVLDDPGRARMVDNIADHLSNANEEIQKRALENFSQVHLDFGRLLKEALDVINYHLVK